MMGFIVDCEAGDREVMAYDRCENIGIKINRGDVFRLGATRMPQGCEDGFTGREQEKKHTHERIFLMKQ